MVQVDLIKRKRWNSQLIYEIDKRLNEKTILDEIKSLIPLQ